MFMQAVYLIAGISYNVHVNILKREMDFTFSGIEAPTKGNEKRESNTKWYGMTAFIAVPPHIWYGSTVSGVYIPISLP